MKKNSWYIKNTLMLLLMGHFYYAPGQTHTTAITIFNNENIPARDRLYNPTQEYVSIYPTHSTLHNQLHEINTQSIPIELKTASITPPIIAQNSILKLSMLHAVLNNFHTYTKKQYELCHQLYKQIQAPYAQYRFSMNTTPASTHNSTRIKISTLDSLLFYIFQKIYSYLFKRVDKKIKPHHIPTINNISQDESPQKSESQYQTVYYPGTWIKTIEKKSNQMPTEQSIVVYKGNNNEQLITQAIFGDNNEKKIPLHILKEAESLNHPIITKTLYPKMSTHSYKCDPAQIKSITLAYPLPALVSSHQQEKSSDDDKFKSFDDSDSCYESYSDSDSDSDESPNDSYIPVPVLAQKGWESVKHAGAHLASTANSMITDQLFNIIVRKLDH